MKISHSMVVILCLLSIQSKASNFPWQGSPNKAIANVIVKRDMTTCQHMNWRVSEEASWKFIVRCSVDKVTWQEYEVVPTMEQIKKLKGKVTEPGLEKIESVTWAGMKESYDKKIAEETRASRIALEKSKREGADAIADLISSSDDWDKHKSAFITATSKLIREKKCTLEHLKNEPGWWRSQNYKPAPIYFIHCGGAHVKNRIYLDVSTGRIFR